MRVLIISPLFPPFANSEAYCGGKFVKVLIAAGAEAAVICSSNIYTPPRFDTSTMWHSLARISIDVQASSPTPVLGRCWLGAKYQTTSWTHWTHRAVSRAEELHGKTPFDLIISRSMPGHAHVAGFWIASRLVIPWVAIANDPWDFSPFVAVEESRREMAPGLSSRFWWRRIVARADRLCFPSERLRDHCLKGMPRKSGIVILPHIGASSQFWRHVDTFVIVHAGKLGVDELTGRSAVALLEGLKELFRIRPSAESRTRLVFVGQEDPRTTKSAALLGLGKHILWTGLVSYAESLDYMAQAAVCVLIESDFGEGVFLPSKLCDYIVARKPVLALSPEFGTVADLAVERGITRVSPRDSIAVGVALVKLFDAFTDSRLHLCAPSDSLARRFEARKVIDDFLASVTPLALGRTQQGARRGHLPALPLNGIGSSGAQEGP
jgi:glycosyltransferase involved in cell wall biosynthesis